MNLTYYDPRYGDMYNIELLPDGTFAQALRFVDNAARDPIHYLKLSDIPSPHDEAIKQLIWTLLHPTRP